MPPLSALIFDVDGTLAETEELHRAAFNAAFAAENGPGWHWDQALYGKLLAVTGGKERITHYGPNLPAARVAALHAAKTARYGQLMAAGGPKLRPGVRRLLEAAHGAGVKRAVATTTSPANVAALLAAVGPLPPFDVIAAGDEVAAKKPAPDIFLLALDRLGLPADACVAIEDTDNGLRSARGAGLRCVVTTSLYGGRGPFPGAAAVVSDLGDPGAPAERLAGPPLKGGIVDLAWLAGLPKVSA
jgi:HAD superfamily hydrolase (TIGR01509 family)